MKHNKKIGKRHAYWFYINSSRQNTSQDLIRPNTAHNTTPSTKSSVRSNATPSIRSNTKLKESDSKTSNGKTQRNHSTQNSTRSDVVNITLHFFLKDIRPMLPPAMKHSIAVS